VLFQPGGWGAVAGTAGAAAATGGTPARGGKLARERQSRRLWFMMSSWFIARTRRDWLWLMARRLPRAGQPPAIAVILSRCLFCAGVRGYVMLPAGATVSACQWEDPLKAQ
jgi:hypothetical protein